MVVDNPLPQDSAKRCFSFNEITRSDQKSGYRSVDWTLAQQFVKGTFLVGNLYTIDEGGANFLVGTLRQLPIRFHSYESAGMVALATVLTVAVGPCLLSVRTTCVCAALGYQRSQGQAWYD